MNKSPESPMWPSPHVTKPPWCRKQGHRAPRAGSHPAHTSYMQGLIPTRIFIAMRPWPHIPIQAMDDEGIASYTSKDGGHGSNHVKWQLQLEPPTNRTGPSEDYFLLLPFYVETS
ncbi:hypothetical protein TIFTF001_009160 [Ficus carica]|uniref:Uncharacterized protein n=1 Tax=Ficus carica TaxID=3494 RepID=A0AA87ZU77_FICCA|nr:hypothetical protein TIFTF001_009160 [Ficus carica]